MKKRKKQQELMNLYKFATDSFSLRRVVFLSIFVFFVFLYFYIFFIYFIFRFFDFLNKAGLP